MHEAVESTLQDKNRSVLVDHRRALLPADVGGDQLALDRGRVVTRDELLQKVWGRRETHRDRTVDVFVRRLRQKVDKPASKHSFIQTRFGVGYKLEPEPQ